MKELIERPSAIAKITRLERGKRLGEFHVGHINYQDGPLKNGAWQEIDTELRLHAPTGTYRMTAAGYEAEIGPAGTVRFTNVDHALEFALPNKNKIEPVPSDNAWGRLGKGLIWRNLLQPGGHLEVQARNGSLAKIFHFDTKPESNEIEFEVKTGGSGRFRKDVQEQRGSWSLKGRQATFGATEDRLTFIRTPRAWNHRGESIDITMLFFVRGGRTYATKQIPQAFIDKTFNEPGAWLETDTTTSYYSGSGDGYIVCSGKTYDWTWTEFRNGTPGVYARTTNDYETVSAEKSSNSNEQISRVYIPIDSSGLGSGVILASAYLSAVDQGSEVTDRIHLVTNSTASNTALSYADASDYNAIGGSSLGYQDIGGGGRRSYGLATGYVNKTGYTKLALRHNNDLNNIEPADNSGYQRVMFFLSEASGTGNDPYLSVTYSPAPLVVTPGAGSASTSKVDPTVVLGSINLTPAAGSAATSKVDPTVPYPSQWITPDVAVATTSVAGPTVVYGSITIAPAIAEAATAKMEPTVVLGSVQVTPAPGSAATTKGDPTLHWSSLTMTPAAGYASSGSAGPTVVLGSVIVSPAPGTAIAEGVDPVVDLKLWRAKWYNSGPGFLPGDIIMTQRRDINVAGTAFDIYRAYGNVIAVGTDPVTGKEYADIYIAQGQEYFTDYDKDIEWVAIGNTINPARAAVIYMTADEEFSPRIEMRSGVDSFEKFGSMETLRVAIGNLSGIVCANFGTLSGYGIFTDNAWFTGNLALGSATSMTAGAGLWATKAGDFRIGDPATNKTLTFTASTGVVALGSAVALQWSSVTGSGKPENNATAGADWAANLANIPIRFANAPSGAGLYVTASYLGFYDASTWTAYIANNGQWYFGGNENNFVAWDGSTVTVKGSIAMNGGSINWSNVSAPDYSEIGGTKPPYNADNTAAAVGSKLTYIDSSGIYTGTLTTTQLNAGAATVLGAVTAGSFNIGSGKFVVTSTGDVTMASANVTGSFKTSNGANNCTINGSGAVWNFDSETVISIDLSTQAIHFSWSDGTSNIYGSGWTTDDNTLNLVAQDAVNVSPALQIGGANVTYGANDSGGAGYRLLRIPNA